MVYKKNCMPTHQQPTPTYTIHKRRSKRLHTTIPWHPSSTQSIQNHTSKTLQKASTYQPIPELYITSFNTCKSKFDRADNVVSSEKDSKEENNISWQPYNKMSVLEISSWKQLNNTTEEKNEQQKYQKKNPSPTINSTKEQVNNLEKHSISTTSKLHSTPTALGSLL